MLKLTASLRRAKTTADSGVLKQFGAQKHHSIFQALLYKIFNRRTICTERLHTQKLMII